LRSTPPRPTPYIDVSVVVAPERRPKVEAALASLEHRNQVHVFFSEDHPLVVSPLPATHAS
jgi:hypothetical protein